jgi:hypothetical protein
MFKYPVSYIHVKGYLEAVPGVELPFKNKPLPLSKGIRKNMGRHWWIEFDMIDVKERIELRFRDRESLYCLRVTEYTALIHIPVVIMEGTGCF